MTVGMRPYLARRRHCLPWASPGQPGARYHPAPALQRVNAVVGWYRARVIATPLSSVQSCCIAALAVAATLQVVVPDIPLDLRVVETRPEAPVEMAAVVQRPARATRARGALWQVAGETGLVDRGTRVVVAESRISGARNRGGQQACRQARHAKGNNPAQPILPC